MRCPGKDKCRYAYCESGYIPPTVGSLCPFEEELSSRLEAWFRAQWDLLTICGDVDDYEELVTEFVNVNLQRGRAMSRLNESTTTMGNRGSWVKATKEAELADLYLDRLKARQDRLDAALEAGLDRMRERAERLRPVMPIIEYVFGARSADETSSEPIWDEFVDSDELPPACDENVDQPAGQNDRHSDHVRNADKGE